MIRPNVKKYENVSGGKNPSSRVQKYLSNAGFGSRRAMEALLKEGRININGKVAQLGDTVKDQDKIAINDGRYHRVKLRRAKSRVLAYNKPVGVVSSRAGNQRWSTIYEGLPKEIGFRWVSIGRLDVNTSGLILFTDNGDLASRLMHPSRKLDREYAVRVFGEMSPEKLQKLKNGVLIDREKLRFSDVVRGNGEGVNRWYTCVVQSGKNREVRKIWESQGVKVSRLIRVRFGNVLLPVDLRPGSAVELGAGLVRELFILAGMEKVDG